MIETDFSLEEAKQENLKTALNTHLGEYIQDIKIKYQEISIEIDKKDLLAVCKILKNQTDVQFDGLMDISGVDYLEYGIAEWVTDKATGTGFDRGVIREQSEKITKKPHQKPRFAVVYHLLSYFSGQRLRLKVYVEESLPIVSSVVDIWPSANWYEREVFDLYGILFEDHPDLRRILTDYGFIGHPFRKDFPLSGTVEVRYDAQLKRVIYEPVEIVPRLLVPKVIRDKNNV